MRSRRRRRGAGRGEVAGRGEGAGRARLLAVAVLSVVNVALIVAILQKNELFPFEAAGTVVEDSAETGPESADATDPAVTVGAEAASGQTPTAGQQNPDLLSTDSVAGEAVLGGDGSPDEITTVDDWPGGRGPVPDGPPTAREALFDGTGLLVLTGSVPSWAVATQIVEAAGARLPEGIGSVDNQLTWHPDASDRLRSGTVRLDPAVLYPSGSTAVPDEAADGLDRVTEILASNQDMFAVIIGHTDDLGDTDENAAVAFARATGVVDYLQSQGANPAQIVISSAGGNQTAASNETEEGRTINRRIEIQFENFLSRGSPIGS